MSVTGFRRAHKARHTVKMAKLNLLRSPLWGAVPCYTLSPAATLDAGDISARGRAVDL